jgi:hypothetical protein
MPALFMPGLVFSLRFRLSATNAGAQTFPFCSLCGIGIAIPKSR